MLRGYYAIYTGEQKAQRSETFTTTGHLSSQLQVLAGLSVRAVFHAAAVSDFTFGNVWEQSPDGKLTQCKGGKISTRHGQLLAELVPTPKVIRELRNWFPLALIVGWKFEVDGNRESAIAKAQQQIAENRTNACVTNGRAYGDGFGLVIQTGQCIHLADAAALYAALEKFV